MATETQIERAARALYEVDPDSAAENTDWNDTGIALGGRPIKDYYRDFARAALAAAREPVTQDDREARSAAWEAWKAQSGAEDAESFQAGWLAARPSVPTVTAEQVREAARAADGAEWASPPWVHTFLAALGIEVQP